MASRPFASVLLPIELLTDHSEPEASYHYNTKAIPGRHSQTGGSESISPFQRTSSKRSKAKPSTALPKVSDGTMRRMVGVITNYRILVGHSDLAGL